MALGGLSCIAHRLEDAGGLGAPKGFGLYSPYSRL